MNKLIIADFLTLPIDEGLKKFTFNFMKYALTRSDVDVYSSPVDIGLDGVRLYRANKLMCSKEIKRLLNAAQYKSVYYIRKHQALSIVLSEHGCLNAWFLQEQM